MDLGTPPSPTLAQLRAFVAVADHLHFGGAAAELRVSQPAVSNAVAALEQCLQARLVERTTRRVLLTAQGEAVAVRAREVLAAVDALVATAEHGRHPHTGPLRIGVIPTVAPYLLPSLLAALRRAYPRLRPQVTEDQTARLLEGLAANRLDVVVLALPSGASGLVELPLYDEDFVLLVPARSELDGATGLPPEVLQERELLLLEEGHCLREQALDVCRQAGASADRAATATSLATVTQLVAAGLGSTLLPDSAVDVETRHGPLGTARFAPPAPGRRIGLVHRGTDPRADEHAELADLVRASSVEAGMRVRAVTQTAPAMAAGSVRSAHPTQRVAHGRASSRSGGIFAPHRSQRP